MTTIKITITLLLVACGPSVETETEPDAQAGQGGAQTLAPSAGGQDAGDGGSAPCSECCSPDGSECMSDEPVGVYCPTSWTCLKDCLGPLVKLGQACHLGVPCSCEAGLVCKATVTFPTCHEVL